MPPSSSARRGMDAEFLRSINVRLDAAYPDRISHFRPTAKGLQFVKSLFGDGAEKAHLVVAPYGSGKSLAATFLLQLVENRPEARKALGEIGKRLSLVSPDLYEAMRGRQRRGQKGLVLALQGHAPSVGEALKDAAIEGLRRQGVGRRTASLRRLPTATAEDLLGVLGAVVETARDEAYDRVVILWDEFGRHLEALVAEGKPGALVDVQLAAETASRSSEMPVSLGLLLHRGLLHYATNMPQAVLGSWKKVEGRFKTLQYVDDSKELYRLAAEVVEARRSSPPGGGVPVAWAARECKAQGLFPDFGEQELADVLRRAYPLEPVTLHLLPRLAARVAQNERTLFGFLHAQALRQPVSPEALFDYFSPAMQSDVGPGGTSKQWLETQSALLKSLDIAGGGKAIKTTSLLGLGVGGERSRTGRELLLFSLSGFDPAARSEATVEALLARKLLLHRQHSDEVSVWHGTDLDLRTRLEEEKARQRPRLDTLAVLAREVPPPIWRPVEYNDDLGVRRFVDGQYLTPRGLKGLFGPELHLPALGPVPDAQVIYMVTESADECQEALSLVTQSAESARYLIAIPREPLALSDAVLEVWALLQLSRDPDLIGSDPFASAELAQMLDDARGHLRQLAERLIRPSGVGPRWFYQGSEVAVASARDLRGLLSRIMRQVFSKTPRIWNEMIVRQRPSAVVVNARKKLVMGILERSGEENLGLQGNFPDSSIFRTALLRTGLYVPSQRGWRFAKPEEVTLDKGLRAVWSCLEAFFTEPSDSPKSVTDLLRTLTAPPFGVRAGLLPILVAAAFKAFPSSIALTKDAHYVGDVLPSEIETLCREPERFHVRVLRLSPGQLAYVRGFLGLFGVAPQSDEPQDLIRLSFDVLEGWKSQLPAGAWTTASLSEGARSFREAVSRETDPYSLLFRHIPRACGKPLEDVDELLLAVRMARNELAGVTGGYRASAEHALRRLMGLGGTSAGVPLSEVAAAWSECFREAFVSKLADGIGKGLISRAATQYDTPVMLLDSVSSLLVGKTIDRWDDGTIPAFERELQSVVRRVEEAAIADATVAVGDGGGADALARLVAARIQELRTRLDRLVGAERARGLLQQPIRTDSREGRRRRGNAS